ncbi:MAG TPA: glycogen/starch/alpha-glucan phosphorylase [Planctomycetota bacterium]|nr:glycogen/starch/alpha-glucan phosphorylase [Planctomycetota bacterium]
MSDEPAAGKVVGGLTGRRTKGDYHKGMDAVSLAVSISNHLKYTLAKHKEGATLHDQYWSVACAIRDRMIDRWIASQATYHAQDVKRAYYLSMEYLPGRTLRNAVINLGLAEEFQEAMKELGFSAAELFDVEPDAGLGNGGLGRLASCLLDALATLQIPTFGYGLRYEFGMFRQSVRKGAQSEEPDYWLRLGSPWETQRPEATYPIKMFGNVEWGAGPDGKPRRVWVNTHELWAVPCDVPIPGYGNNTVNLLRLWSATGTDLFDLEYFNSGDYIRSIERATNSENITKILYPNDKTSVGQELRLRQEYFLASASLQDIVRRFKRAHTNFEEFPDKVAIQINDTHPAVAVAELMRLFLDIEGLEWTKAWDLTVRTFGYTNHTLMPEALEKWSVELFGRVLPRHLEIIYEINHRFLQEVLQRFPGDVERMRRMSIIEEGWQKFVRMAHLAVVGSHSVNGVSELHAKLLRAKLFADFAEMHPQRFNAKTNGITPRRWLLSCNPGLSGLIAERIGTKWPTDLDQLKRLVPLAEDAGFRESWRAIKRRNKERLAALIERNTGIRISVEALMDVQVKRIHEYKRQLMNLLRVVDLYRRMKEPGGEGIPPRTILFGGKAAPGYEMAKLIIQLVTGVANIVNRDPALAGRLQVIFMENYGVSLAEVIIPAADLSEQISTAGMEASGTGNMKFALNGALTIGTLDGANIEIQEEVGPDNIFIFGATAGEVAALKERGYDPMHEIESSPRLATVLRMIADGVFSPDDPGRFRPILDSLATHDPFLVCRDFEAYVAAQEKVDALRRDPEAWARKSILNTAGMGKFSADRCALAYAQEIWGVLPVPIAVT